MKLKIYNHLRDVNAGFGQVLLGIAGLRKHSAFQDRELDRYAELSKEARAAFNSYIAGVVEKIETDEAGRRFRRRREREQQEESGSG